MLCAIAHAAAQESWPFLLAFAGLPSLPRSMAEATSYAERFQYWRIEQLSEVDARDALAIPARAEGVTWSAQALDVLVAASGRYPYFLQQFGQDTWSVAEGTRITAHDAQVGVELGTRQLDVGFFRVRWDRASKTERNYLRAMSVDGDSTSSGAVAERLGKRPNQLGPARASLIAKGLIYAPEHGEIAFTVPGMAKFIARELG